MSKRQRQTRTKAPNYHYQGLEYELPKDGVQDPHGHRYYFYKSDTSLQRAVKLAIALKRPLLLEGEPGCGKTQVASAIAYELTQENQEFLQSLPKDFTNQDTAKDGTVWWHFHCWNVKSTTRAKDGLYSYDAIRRLQDAQLIGAEQLQTELVKEMQDLKQRLQNPAEYLSYGSLGDAYQNPHYRPVVLIDEIDKADSDFPNDLLLELDQNWFEIPELGGKRIPDPDHPAQIPIILITSNQEKPLPDAFLRRCLYFRVNFPMGDELVEIAIARLKLDQRRKSLVKAAVKRFLDLREYLHQYPDSRPPGTSEFLDFLQALVDDGNSTEARETLNNLAQDDALLGTLVKTALDTQRSQDHLTASKR